MPRKAASRNLPSLGSLPLQEPSDTRSKTDFLLDSLRELIAVQQSEERQTFYSMRGAARHFHMSLTVVSSVYGQLEKEGLLLTLRGSRTVIQGRQTVRRITTKALIGMPALYPDFLDVHNYRVFFTRLRAELSAHGFNCESIDYQETDAGMENCLRRLLAQPVDILLWLFPHPRSKEVAMQVADRGVRLVSVNDDSLALSQNHYQLSRNKAILKGLAEWDATGIESAIIARQDLGQSLREIYTVEQLLQNAKYPYRFSDLGNGDPKEFLKKLAEDKSAGVILAGERFSSLLCYRAPQAVCDLLARKRVMLPYGPCRMPLFLVPQAPVDLVCFDWELVVRRIVSDLMSQKPFQASEPVIFEAQWLPQTPNGFVDEPFAAAGSPHRRRCPPKAPKVLPSE